MQRVWISRYHSGVPAIIEYPGWTVPDLLSRSATRFPDSSALATLRQDEVSPAVWRSFNPQGEQPEGPRALCSCIETSWPMHSRAEPNFRNSMKGKRSFLAQCPLFHSYVLSSCQDQALAAGSPIILVPRFHADEAGKAIHKYRSTNCSGGPMVFSR